MIEVKPKTLIDFVKANNNLQLFTEKRRVEFTASIVHDNLEYTVSKSGKLRRHEFKRLENVCTEFSKTNSFHPSAYKNITFNASYTLALIRKYLDSSPIYSSVLKLEEKTDSKIKKGESQNIGVRSKISLNQIQAAFEIAGQVYENKISAKNAMDFLHNHHSLNKSSARNLINQFRRMNEGKMYELTQNLVATEHFLREILKQRGRDAAENAIHSTWQHIAYYETVKGSQRKELRALLENFQASLSGEISERILQSQFAANVALSAKDSSADRKKRLNAANKIPEIILTTIKHYCRNADVVAEVLVRAEGKCEICKGNAPFNRKSNGKPYLEVHHVHSLSQGGYDSIDNALAVCPNCHREEHHG